MNSAAFLTNSTCFLSISKETILSFFIIDFLGRRDACLPPWPPPPLPPPPPAASSAAVVDAAKPRIAAAADDKDLAGDADADPEEVAEVRELAAVVIGRYRALLGRLEGDDRTELQRSLGLKVAKIEGLLTALPAAPA